MHLPKWKTWFFKAHYHSGPFLIGSVCRSATRDPNFLSVSPPLSLSLRGPLMAHSEQSMRFADTPKNVAKKKFLWAHNLQKGDFEEIAYLPDKDLLFIFGKFLTSVFSFLKGTCLIRLHWWQSWRARRGRGQQQWKGKGDGRQKRQKMHSPELGRTEGTDSYTEKEEEEEERAISEIGIRCREGGGEKGGGQNLFHTHQME